MAGVPADRPLRAPVLAAIGLAVITVAVYAPVHGFGFVSLVL